MPVAVKEADEAVTEKKGDAPKIRYRVRPRMYSNFDSASNAFEFEVHLPGVPKENIHLRVLPDLFDLKATREESLYALTEYFPYPIDVDSLEAKYANGLLRMKGRLKDPLSDAVEITLD